MSVRIEWTTAECVGVFLHRKGSEAPDGQLVTEPYGLQIGPLIIEGDKEELAELVSTLGDLFVGARKPHVRVEQAAILEALDRPASLSAIAEQHGISTTAAARKLEGLVVQGKVERHRVEAGTPVLYARVES